MLRVLAGGTSAPRRAAPTVAHMGTDVAGRRWVFVREAAASNIFDGIMLEQDAVRLGYISAPLRLTKGVA